MTRWLRLASGIDRLNEWVGRAVMWLTLVMVLVGSYNALVRYLAQFAGGAPESGLGGVLRGIGEVAVDLNSNAFIEAQWYLFSLVFLGAAAYTLLHDEHVRVDVVFTRLSRRGKAWINLGGTLLFLLPFCALMLWATVPSVMNSWAVREMSPDPGGLPRYPIKTVIPIAFVLLFLQGVAMAIKQVATLRGRIPADAADEDRPHPPAEGI
ncbi:MAG: TRAP transporter small permease subunit [Bacteroidetes bacterium]|jgi:TRAP-type mannitol/chloroaromatic compound transport system permease small subunit|nr:TRAP transporter small permease subunit [Bacteroidota bacterium]